MTVSQLSVRSHTQTPFTSRSSLTVRPASAARQSERDPIQAFSDQQKADRKAAKTISAYARDLRLLEQAILTVAPASALLTVDSQALIAALTSPTIQNKPNGKPRAAGSIERLKAASRSFFSWAVDEGLRADNPAQRVKLRRVSRKVPEFLSQRAKTLVLRELRARTGFAALRDRVMIETFLCTGLRLQELINLNVADVDLDNKRLLIVGKGDVPQAKFLKTDLRALFRRYLRERAKKAPADVDALFFSNRLTRISAAQVDNRVRYWVAKAGIEQHVTPHTLRHTFATHLYEKTGDLLVVKEALGHADISTTLIYTHLSNQALADAIERL